MLDLVHILDQYELLDLTAHHLRPIDLFNTALTCKRLHSIVLRSKSTFERLKRVTLCDGTGLRARQEYTGLFAWRYLSNKKPFYDEEIEAKVWNLRCDEHGALPCLKCGTNVCGECRYVTRVRDTNGLEFSRRPHFTYTHQRINLIVYCGDCGVVVQEKSGDALCDCDQYTRWICVRCKTKEIEDERWYSKNRTEHTDDDDGGMLLSDHQCQKAYWCPCGKRAGKLDNIRCFWCRRKHNTKIFPGDQWEPRHRDLVFPDEDPAHVPGFGGRRPNWIDVDGEDGYDGVHVPYYGA